MFQGFSAAQQRQQQQRQVPPEMPQRMDQQQQQKPRGTSRLVSNSILAPPVLPIAS